MSIYTIYKITNLINNKVYIGYTSKCVKERFHQHCAVINCNKFKDYKLQRAIKKYSKNSFKVEEIYQSKLEHHTLNEMESHFISQYDSYNNGYNMTLGGEGFSSEIATKNLKIRTDAGDNPFSGKSGSILSKRVNKQRVDNGTHNFLGNTYTLDKIKNGTFELISDNGIQKKLLGIQLYKFHLRESKTKISCICGSLKFNSLFEASEYHEISMSHLKDRIISKTKKFGNWHISLDDKNFNDYYLNPLKYT